MRMYLEQNVLDAALNRMRWLFKEFENIHVDHSGGKDSTVILNLALKVAEEQGRLPITLTFIDQEAEWTTVINHLRTVMADPRVDPHWYQMPIRLFNATSTIAPWLMCWEEGKEWIRPKEPGAITVNRYRTDRFGKLFDAILDVEYPDQPACHIAGVRCEESPARARGLTTFETYKGETWGSRSIYREDQYNFYPIYDWAYTDVWKAIHDHDWAYCNLYDSMYQYGIPVRQMRVSNVHHETAVKTLFYLQEIEPETWNAITRRIGGINTAGQLQDQFFSPSELPPMFQDWREYRDHLLENLITDPSIQEKMRRQFESGERIFDSRVHPELIKMHISVILTNDYEGTKFDTFRASHMFDLKKRQAKDRKKQEDARARSA